MRSAATVIPGAPNVVFRRPITTVSRYRWKTQAGDLRLPEKEIPAASFAVRTKPPGEYDADPVIRTKSRDVLPAHRHGGTRIVLDPATAVNESSSGSVFGLFP